MLNVKGIVVLLFLSVFLASCHHPFISIEVRTGGEVLYSKPKGDGPQAGCWPPMSYCPGEVEAGTVEHVQKVDPLTFYRIKMGKEYRNFSEPPAVVEGTIEKGDTVEIHISDDGTMTMKKAK